MNLSPRQIEFLHIVKSAAFSNPFSEERDVLDMQIAGITTVNSPAELLAAMVGKINDIVARYDQKKGVVSIQDFKPEHQKLIRWPILFFIFHRYIDRIDELIVQQEEKGTDTITVAWAGEFFEEMKLRGFTFAETTWSISSFYQLRRAFFFIQKEIKGNCPSVRKLRMRLWNNIFSHSTAVYEQYLWNRMEEYSTLILGETGTGKSRAARAIGCSGFIPFDTQTNHFRESFVSAFVSINLSQFPESIIESELFGHQKGAFTGATSNQKGVFDICSPYGAIFLDEIGEISIPTQVKLLQVLQDRTYYAVGSREPKYFKGRVIAATNQNLDSAIVEGRFRRDFYYRLCSDVITMPDLSQRFEEDPAELSLLTDSVLTRLVGEGAEHLKKSIEEKIILTVGLKYSWPGNVREFEQCIRSLLISGSCEKKDFSVDKVDELYTRMLDGTLSADELLGNYCLDLYQKLGSYEQVAEKIRLDRRTVKKYIEIVSGAHDQGEL